MTEVAQAQHTPGPWTQKHTLVGDDEPVIRIWADDRMLAEVWIDSRPEHMPTDEANARLIAAAPELLEVLQGLMERDHKDEGANLYHCYCSQIWDAGTAVDGFDAPAPSDCLYCQAIAAIAKATGAQS